MEVLIVDDHPVVRIGLRTMLESEENIRVTGVAASAAEAISSFERLVPDVVLMDLRMPEMEGTEAIRAMRRMRPEARILVLTNYEEDESILRALQAGASGYLLKSTPHAEIVDAMRKVHRGERYVPPKIAQRLLDTIGREELSQREHEVLELVARGLTNKGIAEVLRISDKTVRNHVTSCLEKLGAADRTEAVTIAVRRGLIRISP